VRELTSQGEQAVADLSTRYGVSTDAVRALLEAVRRGNGTMAQFSHPELGGHGQWMAGGMTMVGDMFNPGLQGTVSGLASDLSSLIASTPVYGPASGPLTSAGPGSVHQADPGSWWPAELGRPGSSGRQNDPRYSVFPQARRLAVQSGGETVRVYDTLDHVIYGVQQGGQPDRLSFTSQHGTFTVESLPLAGPDGSTMPPGPGPAAEPAPAGRTVLSPPPPFGPPGGSAARDGC
jgi:hypothetical protein